jgi:lantibiotic modifying enzyme
MSHGSAGIALALARWDGRAIDFGDADPLRAGWCNGRQGVHLARFAIAGSSSELSLDDADNDGLCHGEAGDLEIARTIGTARPSEMLTRYGRLIARVRAHDIRSGDPVRVATPGLMNGLAGIGLALLGGAAWVERATMPSVLLFEAFERKIS